MNIQMFIIDPQNDFCQRDGALSVPGALDDMKRLAKMVKRIHRDLDDIHVTLDSHHSFDVGHPVYWRDSRGNHPIPFENGDVTIISANDIKSGRWVPSIGGREFLNRMIGYAEALEAGGRYPICIWPPHCLIGSEGHNVVPELFEALGDWEAHKKTAWVDYVTKGSNPYTEHYSAVKAEVPDPEDPSTQINTGLIDVMKTADIILTGGEAALHCVKYTVGDTADAFGDPSLLEKFMLITDAMSPVGDQAGKQAFIDEMVAKNMRTTTTEAFDPRKVAVAA